MSLNKEKSIPSEKEMQEAESRLTDDQRKDSEIRENNWEQRQTAWNETAEKVEHVTDALGEPVDEDIKNTVIAMNVLGINTAQSCGGHVDQGGLRSPWVSIEAPNEPDERYVRQNEIFEKVAQKFGVPTEEVKRGRQRKAYEEAMRECSEMAETEEFKQWREGCGKLLYVIKEMLKDFYSDRQTSDIHDDARLHIDAENMQNLPGGVFWMHSGQSTFRDKEIPLSEEEKKSLEEKLAEQRKEIQEFTDFLKGKFFTEGENYLTSKLGRAQEKIDAEKIRQIKAEMIIKQMNGMLDDQFLRDLMATEEGLRWMQKFLGNQRLMDELKKEPSFFYSIGRTDETAFESPEHVENIIYYGRLRELAGRETYLAMRKRLETDPYASEEEISAGTYWENLEPQVREAIKILRTKGYSTFESGFNNPADGSQYVGFKKGEVISIPSELKDYLKVQGIELKLRSNDDREQMFLIPSKQMNLKQWKEIWDKIAEMLPATGKKSEPSMVGMYDVFLKKQREMKAGKETYIHTGFIFKDGKITEL